MLDSSPVALPPPPRPLKRSASVASLPTPPRTRHRTRKTRGRSRGSLESDSDGNSAGGVSTDGSGDETRKNNLELGEPVNIRKRRRTKDVLEDEEAFWLGKEFAGEFEGRKRGRGRRLGRSSSFKVGATASDLEPETAHQDAPLLYQRLRRHQDLVDEVKREKTKVASTSVTPVEPVSPPPSHRRTTRASRTLGSTVSFTSPASSTTVRSPPVTPRPKNKGKKRLQRVLELPVRDSPNNPFLGSPRDHTHTPTSLEERPTITYVFRGVRGVYPNPLYNHAKKRALSPPPKSLLPPEHPDYSPDMRCPPRLLFPARLSKTQKRHDSLEEPTTPTSNRTSTKEKGDCKEDAMNLPKMKDAVLGPGLKGRRSPSPYETFGASDGEDGNDDGEDGDAFCEIKPMKLDFGAKACARDTKRGEGGSGGGNTSLMDELSRPNLAPRVKH